MLTRPYIQYASVEELYGVISTVCSVENEHVIEITDKNKLEQDVVFLLQYTASVSDNIEVKQTAIRVINEISSLMQIQTGSNVSFYDEKASGQHEFFTVPAINCRMLTFHMVRSAMRAANSLSVPHLIFELALSESGYTDQQMDEYAALTKAAFISLGLNNHTIYLQADHYQLDPKKYEDDPDAEKARVQAAITKAIEHGVYNIDIDTSKFETADPQKTDKENQQKNAQLTAEMFHYIRQYEKDNDLPCTISIGGEVGEVGGENTKYPQVNAYLDLLKEYSTELGSGDEKAISKVSINVGSAHGGVLGPDGLPLDSVPLDFQAHHDLYMKGQDPMNPRKHVVSAQHGASTLPKKYFALFPAVHTGEIHLATGFQNLIWKVLEEQDLTLFEKMKSIAFEKFGEKIAKYPTEAIGFVKERKRVTQFIKKELLQTAALPQIEQELEQEFSTIFHSLYTLLASRKGIVEEGDRDD